MNRKQFLKLSVLSITGLFIPQFTGWWHTKPTQVNKLKEALFYRKSSALAG